MVSLKDVRAHNSSLKALAPGLVGVFVGGTSGIGLFTVREFVRNTTAPHVYLVGRNQTEATRIIEELRQLNPDSKLNFIQKDVSLLRNVDEACKEIQAKESKINLLFMTIGYFTYKGREETVEGLDRKFSLHYYARMRFLQNLAPLLTAASNDGTLARVVSVLDPNPGKMFQPNFGDLSLKTTFSLKNCAAHASLMNNFAIEHFAKQHPTVSFIHQYPSAVETGAGREISGPITGPLIKILYKLITPFTVNPKESGERHLYSSTAPQYAAKAKAAGVQGVAEGADGVKGSGAYHVSWNNDIMPDTAKNKALRDDGAEKKIWDHTHEVFQKIIEGDGKY